MNRAGRPAIRAARLLSGDQAPRGIARAPDPCRDPDRPAGPRTRAPGAIGGDGLEWRAVQKPSESKKLSETVSPPESEVRKWFETAFCVPGLCPRVPAPF